MATKQQRLEQLARPKTAQNAIRKDIMNQNEEEKKKQLQKKEMVRVADENGDLPLIFQKNPVFLVFENKLQAELFNARCHDTGEHIAIEKAQVFKEEFNRINMKKQKNVLNLYSMRLGVNCMINLSVLLQDVKLRDCEALNLADNAISDNGMHSIKSIIANTKIKHLNLSSNMISESGLEMIVDDLSKSQCLISLDLGVHEGSIRKNSLGVDGAKCIAAVILQNRNIESIKLQDNDIGITGGEIIGTALKQNKTLKHLTIAENELKTAGAEFILKAAGSIESLDLGKNYIKSGIGPCLRVYLESNVHLQRLNLEYNELLVTGVRDLTLGLANSHNLISLNLKGNGIRDEGLQLIAMVLSDHGILEELDVSLNEITPLGISYLAEVLPYCSIKYLNLSKNLLGDESLMIISDRAEGAQHVKLQRLDVNSARISDTGILHFLERIDNFEMIKTIKASDNFISEKIEKILLEILDKNKTLVDFQVNGNRLSLCCLNRIKKILSRNNKELEEREPNKIKTEIYRLKYEQQKIEANRRKLDAQERAINELETQKNMLEHKLQTLKRTEEHKRLDMNAKIVEQKTSIQRKKEILIEKSAKFEARKNELVTELTQLQGELSIATTERDKVSSELDAINNEIESTETNFKNQLEHMEQEFQKQKVKKEEIDKHNSDMNAEYQQMLKQEKELLEHIATLEKQNKSSKKAAKNKPAQSTAKI